MSFPPLSCFRYTKYVYPYECHMKNLSSPAELQQAIDGNRREGRRAGYESYNMFPGVPPGRPQVPLPPTSLSLPQISPLPPGVRPPFNGNFPGNIASKYIKKTLFCGEEYYIFPLFKLCVFFFGENAGNA